MPRPSAPAQLDWNLLRSFGAVMDQGSFTQAAAQLGSSQPTLSRQIAQLEAALGAPLFERTARGLLPTAAARALAEPAARMLAAAQACAVAADDAAGAQATLAGTVRLTASEVVSCHVLPPILAALAQRHPQVQIELVASDKLGNLLEHEADIAVRMVRPTQTALITRHIADWPLGLYAHHELLAREGVGVGAGGGTAFNLASARKVGFDQSQQMIEGFRRAGFELTRHDFHFRSDHQLVGLAAVRAGLGVGVVLVPLARQLPELVRVAPEAALPVLPVWLTAHRALRSSRRLKTVFDWLAEGLSAWGAAAAQPTP
jgi:DNA-binding transcriptional LysR family regulator